jgi:UPF0716 protein FxsA
VLKISLICLLLIPIVEIYLFIRVGGYIGALPVIGLCILTACMGSMLVHKQGIQTIRRVQRKIEQGVVPATELLAGILILAAGVLLLTPGFFTDLAGFLILVPGIRAAIISRVTAYLRRQANSETDTTTIVEGEFWVEPRELPGQRQPAERND